MANGKWKIGKSYGEEMISQCGGADLGECPQVISITISTRLGTRYI